jgi:hypothetical protein
MASRRRGSFGAALLRIVPSSPILTRLRARMAEAIARADWETAALFEATIALAEQQAAPPVAKARAGKARPLAHTC